MNADPLTQPTRADRRFWSSDRQRINKLRIPKGGRLPADTEKLLRVANEYFTAGAVFRRKDGVWHCKECAPILNWMKSTPYDKIKIELLKRGCSWEWLPVNASTASLPPEHKHESFTITSRTTGEPDCLQQNTEGGRMHSGAQVLTAATGETQGMEKLLAQDRHSTRPNAKCFTNPTT